MTSLPSRAALALRIVMAAVFVAAAWFKLREPWQLFAMAIDGYKLLPEWASMFVARTLPWFELGLGIWLLAGVWLRFSAAISTALMTGFLVALVRSYILGLQIDCGCFGGGDALSWKTLLRDGSLWAASAALTWLAFWLHRGRRAVPSPASEAGGAVSEVGVGRGPGTGIAG